VCTRSCPDSHPNTLDNSTCVAECPEYEVYGQKVCVSSCERSGNHPFVYRERKKCYEKCDDEFSSLLANIKEMTCERSCAADEYFNEVNGLC
jgi:hypothetical protein